VHLKSRMNAQERKAAIVEAAVRLFAERGFRGATTRELASAVGVTEPVLYEHFKTKRDLYSAIIDAKSQEGCRLFTSLVGPYVETNDDRGFFRKLAELILEFYETDPDYVRLLMFSALERHELAEQFYDRHRETFFRVVTDYIERRTREGALKKMDSALAARAFTGMVGNYALASTLFKHGLLTVSRKKIIEGMVDIFLDGISNRRNG
jgi:AcrR family transcriptional regulator